jgi:KUP system potassium uptake protein
LFIGGGVFSLMATWRRGRTLLRERLEKETMPLGSFVREIASDPPVRIPGTAVFMSASAKGIPPMLLHHLKLNQMLHQNVILLTVVIEDVPRVWWTKRVEVIKRDQGIYQVIAHYGFMENPNVPKALQRSQGLGLDLDLEKVVYYIGSRTLIPTDEKPGMALWRERLFAFMFRNSTPGVAFFGIPSDRVIELGMQIEL